MIQTNDFFDNYENDPALARRTDEMCLSCPVMAICAKEGIDNDEWGVWGGVYLVRGRVSRERNRHKTAKVWKEIKERISEGI